MFGAGTLFVVLYPIMGWLGDSKFGKYKVLQAAPYLLLSIIVLYNLAVFVLAGNVHLMLIASVLGIPAALCYITTILPFLLDQMIGASGEQLSFAIYWVLCGTMVGWSVVAALYSHESFILYLIGFAVSSTSFLASYLLFNCFSHHLETNSQLSNPIKLTARVLNYARKHKYPERRSALTYWEEEYPSRLDLGKEKYGGPFTFEEVEDVKAMYRLVPVIASFSLGMGFMCNFFPGIPQALKLYVKLGYM